MQYFFRMHPEIGYDEKISLYSRVCRAVDSLKALHVYSHLLGGSHHVVVSVFICISGQCWRNNFRLFLQQQQQQQHQKREKKLFVCFFLPYPISLHSRPPCWRKRRSNGEIPNSEVTPESLEPRAEPQPLSLTTSKTFHPSKIILSSNLI